MAGPPSLRPEDRADFAPVVTVAAATLLLLGHALQLADTPGTLPTSLITTGWVFTLAAASTLIALAALLRTALRRRGGTPTAEQLEQTRPRQQQALLDSATVPHLRRRLTQDLPYSVLPEKPPQGNTTHRARQLFPPRSRARRSIQPYAPEGEPPCRSA